MVWSPPKRRLDGAPLAIVGAERDLAVVVDGREDRAGSVEGNEDLLCRVVNSSGAVVVCFRAVAAVGPARERDQSRI